MLATETLPPNYVMAAGRSSVTVAGNNVTASVPMSPPVSIPPNPAAMLGSFNRYIYWDGLSFTATVHPLIMERYIFYGLDAYQGVSPIGGVISATPNLSSNFTFNITADFTIPYPSTSYGDDLYIEMPGICKSNAVKIWHKVEDATLSGFTFITGEKYILIEDANFVTGSTPLVLPANAVFDGNKKKITVNTPAVTNTYYGLFETNSGIIQNLKIDGTINPASFPPLLSGTALVLGAIAGRNTGTIKNVSSTATIDLTYNDSPQVGGLVGRNQGTIINCYVDATLKNTSTADPIYLGSIAMNNNGGTIQNCWASGDFTIIYTNAAFSTNNMGGIAVSNLSGAIANCVALRPNMIFSISNGSRNVYNIAGSAGSYNNNHIADETLHYDDNGTPTQITTSGSHNNSDGAILLSSNAGSEDWWKTSGVGWGNATIDAWGGADEDHPWVWDNRTGSPTQNLPVLWFELP